jgi:Cd(II)/Pb(II)-responsive transcriptional regulator
MPLMKIGELATATGTAVETIRYYEREGLIAEPGRSEGNYRLYGEPHVQRLTLVRRCRSLDMTLDEIRALLRFKDAPGADCGDVNSLLDEHIGHVAHRIAELQGLATQMRELRAQCRTARSGPDCGILKGLSEPGPGRSAAGPCGRERPGALHGRRARAAQKSG